MAFGHPKGLFPLFFTEMWERLAFYTMVGILLLYTTDSERGGLGLSSTTGNEIYGLYLAFVYFTPFLGGLIADRFLGYRRAVLTGGLLMAGGLFLMSLPGFTLFVLGLIGLIVGNGFFKPNISVMVGNLYAPGDPKRDTGFNIFYMGINIGALVATLFAAPYLRNNWGWLWTFRGAGIGLLIGVAILLAFWRSLERADRQPESDPDDTSLTEIFFKILLPAFAFGFAGYFLARWADFTLIRPAVCGFLAGIVPVLIFFIRLGVTAREDERPGLLALLPVYVAGGAFFMILHLNGSAMTQWARDETDRQPGPVSSVMSFMHQEGLPTYYLNAAKDVPRPHPDSLLVVEDPVIARMFGQQRLDEEAVRKLAAIEGIEVIDLSVAGGEIPEDWRRRAVKVYGAGQVTVSRETGAHGEPVISVSIPDGARPEREVVLLRRTEEGRIPVFVVDRETFDAIYEGYRQRWGQDPPLLPRGVFLTVINPEVYQSWNPFFVILLTPLVVLFFQWRDRTGKPVPTAHKLLWGMVLTTISLLLMAVAGVFSQGGTLKVSAMWLVGFYLIVTLGELCLSPMGLSLVTKLSPKRLVGLTMGGWFLATAFGNNLSGFFGGLQHRMSPTAFFLLLAGLSALVALFILAVLPRLDRAIRKYGA
ncbi:MAG: MFS transporter [Acidobacteria bacterium]|nr:MAG: MFS transporter [Acidobacteriota bacterium]